MARRTWLAMLVIAGNAPLLRAQSRPVFEVASVKATTQRQGLRLDSGRYSDTADLSTFIVMAYGLSSCYAKVSTGAPCPLMAGMLPAWASSTFPSNANLFAIEARLPNDPRIASGYTAEQVHTGKVTQLSLMLQALLEDRFHLNVHREQKEIPVYALTPVRNGAKLKPATSRELTEDADGTSVEHHCMSAFEPVLAPDGSRTGRRRIAFQGASMEQAADVLASYMDRPVVDR